MTQASQTVVLAANARGRIALSRLVLLVIGTFCLQSALLSAFATERIAMPTYIAAYLGLCVTALSLGGWWSRSPSNSHEVPRRTIVVLQLLAWTALAGPFGALIAVGLLIPYRSEPSPGTWNGATGQTGLSEIELLHNSLLDGRLRLDRAHAIRSLLDVIIDGTQAEKLDALSLFSKRFVPALAPVLKRALEDPDAAVRVLAATVMAQRHDSYMRRIGDFRAKAEAAPELPAPWRKLAQACLDYAASGLLDASRAEVESNQASIFLARAEQLDTNSPSQSRQPMDEQSVVAGQDEHQVAPNGA